MQKQAPKVAIMAAGMGSRFGGLKQMEPVDDEGHSIIDFSMYDARRAGSRDRARIGDQGRKLRNVHLRFNMDFIQCITTGRVLQAVRVGRKFPAKRACNLTAEPIP